MAKFIQSASYWPAEQTGSLILSHYSLEVNQFKCKFRFEFFIEHVFD